MSIEFKYGQKIKFKREGRPPEVYVASKEPNDEYVIEMSYVWPFDRELPKCPSFFIHRDILIRNIKKQNYGPQIKMKM